MKLSRLCAILLVWTGMLASLQAAEKVQVLRAGPGAGHFLVWRGKPILPCGDSVTQEFTAPLAGDSVLHLRRRDP